MYCTTKKIAYKAIEFVGEEKIKRYYFDIDEKKIINERRIKRE